MSATEAPAAKPFTIGSVCRQLQEEFADISISKIRYLEDQGLLKPRRTRGGYRLFDEEDVERLRTILRLQRDEFLPLRVIQQELASPAAKPRRRRRQRGLEVEDEQLSFSELCERAQISEDLGHELEEFGLIQPQGNGRDKSYSEGDVDVAAACAQLAQYGVAPRHLRSFRAAADREAAIVEQLVAPALRSRSPERRKAGLDDLQTLAGLAQELSQLLFWRDLRRLARS